MPEIESLESVSLRKAWPDEARDFTPWLVTNIDRLCEAVGLSLESPEREVKLEDAGRVDIKARQAATGATVVIENQLGESDDSHCLRLLGYAANADANILVWVASAFTPYHKSILKWLNETDTIHVYAVVVRAYRVGEALAADFQTVVEPTESDSVAPPNGEKNPNTLYAEFYRPVRAQLRKGGLYPVGKGGWRGKWRSFESRHDGTHYATGLVDGKARVFLYLHGSDQFRALRTHEEEIDRTMKGSVMWGEASEWFAGWEGFLVMLEWEESVDLKSPGKRLASAGQWMANHLLSLRNAVQPLLDQVMGAEDSEPDCGEGIR